VTETASAGNPGLKHASLLDLAPKVTEPTTNDIVMAQLLNRVQEKQTSPKLPSAQLGDKSVGALIAALQQLNSPHTRLLSITGVKVNGKLDGTTFLTFTTN